MTSIIFLFFYFSIAFQIRLCDHVRTHHIDAQRIATLSRRIELCV